MPACTSKARMSSSPIAKREFLVRVPIDAASSASDRFGLSGDLAASL